MNKSLLDILRGFQLDAEPVSCAPYGCGHINATYLPLPQADGAISCKRSTTTRSAMWRA